MAIQAKPATAILPVTARGNGFSIFFFTPSGLGRSFLQCGMFYTHLFVQIKGWCLLWTFLFKPFTSVAFLKPFLFNVINRR